MIKKTVLVYSIWIFPFFVIAQESFSSLNDYGIQQNLQAMKISGVWSAVSIVSGTAGYLSSNDSRKKSMHLTNAAFGIFNSLVVIKGYSDLKKGLSGNWSYAESLEKHRRIERLYVFNNGFNFAFIMGGFYLKEKSKSFASQSKQDSYTGVGDGLIIQGVFFLIFDTLMFQKQKSFYDQKLSKFIPNDVSISMGSLKLMWSLN